MAKCRGRCEKQEYDVRKVLLATTIADPKNPKNCRERPVRKILLKTLLELKKELEADEILTACKETDVDSKCDCSFAPAPPWGKWVNGTGGKFVTVGKCKYFLSFNYEIRSRIRTGACVPVRFTGKPLGFGAKKQFFISIEDGEAVDPGALEKIENVLE